MRKTEFETGFPLGRGADGFGSQIVDYDATRACMLHDQSVRPTHFPHTSRRFASRWNGLPCCIPCPVQNCRGQPSESEYANDTSYTSQLWQGLGSSGTSIYTLVRVNPRRFGAEDSQRQLPGRDDLTCSTHQAPTEAPDGPQLASSSRGPYLPTRPLCQTSSLLSTAPEFRDLTQPGVRRKQIFGSRPAEGCGARNLSIVKACQYRPGQGRCWDLTAPCQNSSKPLMTREAQRSERPQINAHDRIPGFCNDYIRVSYSLSGRT
jgi:hypothetical protein